MSKQTEALKLALEGLEKWHFDKDPRGADQYITAVREALTEPPAQQEIEELTAQRDQLADILTRTANALKGQPAELSSHSWHDLPEVAQQLKAEQQQEPYGYFRYDLRLDAWVQNRAGLTGTPFYTSPPASKPWVGLVWGELPEDGHNHDFLRGAAWAEAKLREKNA